MKQYKARNGAMQFKPSLKWVQNVVQGDNDVGFCVSCGNSQAGVEPDARKYTCESCDAPKVYGAEELMLMGLVH